MCTSRWASRFGISKDKCLREKVMNGNRFRWKKLDFRKYGNEESQMNSKLGFGDRKYFPPPILSFVSSWFNVLLNCIQCDMISKGLENKCYYTSCSIFGYFEKYGFLAKLLRLLFKLCKVLFKLTVSFLAWRRLKILIIFVLSLKSYSRFKTPTFDDIGPCQSRKNRNETKATIIISVKMRRSNRHELLVPILNRKKQKVPDWEWE